MSKLARTAATMQKLSLAAMEEASRTGQRTTDIEHLLLALAIDEHLAGQVLRGFGITLDTAREAVSAQHAAQLASLGITAAVPAPERIVFDETGGYEWSRRAGQILERSTDKGKNGDSAAVLRELVAEPSGMIAELLQRLGTSADEVAGRLDEAERNPQHPTARTSEPHPLSGSAEVFVPAPVEAVWNLLASPERMPEWMLWTQSVEHAEDGCPRPGATWVIHAPTRRPDGKPLRTKPTFQRQHVTLIAAEEPSRIGWHLTFSDAPRANSRRILITLDPAAGGTQLGIHYAWERNPQRRSRPALRLVLTPWYRYNVWMQIWHLGSSISRVFR